MKLCDDLRAAVLQAAISGKLTKQLPEDGDAHDLLKQIAKEKEQLIKDGKIKKEKPLDPIKEDDIPFEIPCSWVRVRIKDITFNWGQKKPKSIFNYIDVGFIDNKKFKLNYNENIINASSASSRARKIVKYGDVLFATIRPYLKNICIVDKAYKCECIASTAFAVMHCTSVINNKYLYYFLLSPFFMEYSNKKEHSKGIAYPAISEKDFYCGIIPLPPLMEQQRIVERVDELMAKIDELEKIETELENLKKQFPDDMKSALLQAAMQGKLTKQYVNENSVELTRIIKNERLKIGFNKYTENSDYYKTYDIPKNWTAIKSGECFSLEKGQFKNNIKLPYLDAKYLRTKVNPTILFEGEVVHKGEKVILVDGENSGEVFDVNEDGVIGSTFKVLFIPKSINIKYGLYFLSMNKDLFRNKKRGAAIPHLNKEIFNTLFMPIPSLEEQQRIVDLLDKLLPLCEVLK